MQTLWQRAYSCDAFAIAVVKLNWFGFAGHGVVQSERAEETRQHRKFNLT